MSTIEAKHDPGPGEYESLIAPLRELPPVPTSAEAAAAAAEIADAMRGPLRAGPASLADLETLLVRLYFVESELSEYRDGLRRAYSDKDRLSSEVERLRGDMLAYEDSDEPPPNAPFTDRRPEEFLP